MSTFAGSGDLLDTIIGRIVSALIKSTRLARFFQTSLLALQGSSCANFRIGTVTGFGFTCALRKCIFSPFHLYFLTSFDFCINTCLIFLALFGSRSSAKLSDSRKLIRKILLDKTGFERIGMFGGRFVLVEELVLLVVVSSSALVTQMSSSASFLEFASTFL